MEKTIKQRCDEWKAKLVEAAVDFAFESQVSSDGGGDSLNRLAKAAVDITPDVISYIKAEGKTTPIPKIISGENQKIDIKEYKKGLKLSKMEKIEVTISVLIAIFLMMLTFAGVAWFFSQ